MLAEEGLPGVFEAVSGETRECHIILGGVLDGRAQPTEIYERGPVVTAADWHGLLRRLPEGQLIVSGSLTRGLAPETFKVLLLELVQSGHKPTVDSSGAALGAGGALVKPNR